MYPNREALNKYWIETGTEIFDKALEKYLTFKK